MPLGPNWKTRYNKVAPTPSTSASSSFTSTSSSVSSGGGGISPTISSEAPVVIEQSYIFSDVQHGAHDLLYIDNKLYLLLESAPTSKVYRFNTPRTDLSNWDVMSFPSDGQHGQAPSMAYSPGTGLIYVVFATSTNVLVSTVNPTTLVTTDVVNDAANTTGQGAIVADNNNIYVLCYSGSVRKYTIPGHALVGTRNIGLPNAHAMQMMSNTLWATGTSIPDQNGWVARIGIGMDLQETLSLGFEDKVPTDDFAVFGTNLLVGFETGAGDVIRVNPFNLAAAQTRIRVLRSSFCMSYAEGYFWNGSNTTPGILSRIDPNNGFLIRFMFLNTDNGPPNEIVGDGAGRIYFTCPAGTTFREVINRAFVLPA